MSQKFNPTGSYGNNDQFDLKLGHGTGNHRGHGRGNRGGHRGTFRNNNNRNNYNNNNYGSDYLADGEYSSVPGTPGSNDGARSGNTSGFNTPAASTTSLSSLSSALLDVENTPISEHLLAIKNAKTMAEIRDASGAIANVLDNHGISGIKEWSIWERIEKLTKPKNIALVKEGSMVALSTLARRYTGDYPNEAYFESALTIPLSLLGDKDKKVLRIAQQTADIIYELFPVEALPSVILPVLLKYLQSSAKWQGKIAALKFVDRIVDDCPSDLLERTFIDTVPVLTSMMHDFKPELSKAGTKSANKFVSILDNNDLSPRFEIIVKTLSDPKLVNECIKTFSHVTFVTEVTEPALSLLVPILDRSLNISSSTQDQLRQTVMVTENLTRLVNDYREIKPFIPILMPGIKKVVATAALPEVRDLASKALSVLENAENDLNASKYKVDIDDILPLIKDEKFADDKTILNYVTEIIISDANVSDWTRLKEQLIQIGYSTEFSDKIVFKLREYLTPDAIKTTDDNGIVIVNTDFSLAYGTRMLLNKTTLRLLKGHRYGLCGRNGAGKSTLMRSIAEGKVDNFPDKSVLRTCFVEHKLQGSDADMNLVAFIASDPELAGVASEEIAKALEEVGFDEERRSQLVGSLSGGWKMKLELARAMLMKADILLLDEPTNHLDVANVKWLEDYLNEHDEITSLIVSHDSGFLDNVCTDIIHYENKKLAYYKGNLSEFVKIKPEGKSYYTLTDSNVKMAFPPPGILTGVRSNTRAVARMSNVTFTYPGGKKPSLSNVSCALSLSSRVAILGANGAGKSTLIKLLTGELMPTTGTVEKHPNLRIGYIAQHALQHVEQHKEKTANQYLQWRYKFGDDREVLLKDSRKISAEEKEQMAKEIDIKDGRGPRAIEAIVGRQKLKKSFQYEIKWINWLPRYNSWVSREILLEHGFNKLIQNFDDHEASREGLGYRELTPPVIRQHFEGVGLDGDIADHTLLGSLSGGQLVKVVIAGAMWNKPHLLVLDEPTNYLDRDSLGGLAVAIRDWTGGVVMISHNNEFVGALCPEQWVVADGKMIQKGKVAVKSDRFEDSKNATSGEESSAVTDADSPLNIKVKKPKKKKMTRKELKEREVRRRLRHIEWLNTPKGTPKPVDTDDEE